MKKLVLVFMIMLMTASLAAADTVYLRDGRTVRGTVLGFIGGRFAVRLSQRFEATVGTNQQRQVGMEGDIIYLRPREVDRIEIDGRSLDEARYRTQRVGVALTPDWIDSGVDVRRGDRVQVTATGTILAGRTRITPVGLRTTDPYAPSPRLAEGALIGAIGNEPDTPIIEIGSSREFVADRDGRLYLTPNRSSYTDARGSFDVQVRTELEFNQRNNTARQNDDNSTDDFDPFGTGTSDRTNPAPPRRRTPGGRTLPVENQPQSLTLEKTITVPGTSRGTDTGIDLRAGDQVTFTASGTVVAGQRAGSVTPDGGRVGVISAYPVPSVGVGALIGYLRLTNGQAGTPFVIGSQNTFTAQEDGRLFLLINDDNYRDNTGSFSVRLVYPNR